MKVSLPTILFCLFAAAAIPVRGHDTTPLFRDDESVRVRYQVQTPGSASWHTGTVTLRGATSESMMINSVSERNPGRRIRILAASSGKDRRFTVRYRLRRGGGSWHTGTAVLSNVRTESMAANQLSAANPGAEIRITGIVER